MNLPRLFGTTVVSLALLAALFAYDPGRDVDVLVKAAVVASTGVGMYWVDRRMFPYARPDRFDPSGIPRSKVLVMAVMAAIFIGCMIRRAIMVVGGMIAAALVF